MKFNRFFAIMCLIITIFVGIGSMGAEASEIMLDLQNTIYTVGTADIAVVELHTQPASGFSWVVASNNLKVLNRTFTADDSNVLGSSGIERIELVSTTGAMNNVLELSLTGRGKVVDTLRYVVNTEGVSTIQIVKPLMNIRKRPLSSNIYKGSVLPAKYMVCDPASHYWIDSESGAACPIVKDQGQCGSCWAFATVGMLETVIGMNDGASTDLSEQFLINCNEYGYGCTGGNFAAHDYHMDIIASGDISAGAVTEYDEPYKQYEGSCKTPYSKRAKIKNWDYVESSDINYPNWPTVTDIKEAMMKYGPIGVGICSDGELEYAATKRHDGGVMFFGSKSGFCASSDARTNHAVVLVGWVDIPDNPGYPSGGYWVMRNSWGSEWGASGYINVVYDANLIGWDANYIDYTGIDPTPTPDGGGDSGGSGCFIQSLF